MSGYSVDIPSLRDELYNNGDENNASVTTIKQNNLLFVSPLELFDCKC